MHPIWRIALGVIAGVARFISPHHGLWSSVRYHAYGNLSGLENAATIFIYLACALLIGSGLYRMLSHEVNAGDEAVLLSK
jgi:hypothetical protein